MEGKNEQRAGLLYGIGAYGMWGLVPLFWPLLEPSGAVEILAHRMVWSLAVVGVALLALRRWAWIRELLGRPRRLALIAVAATVISVNWGLYIWSVNNGHVVEASLGYFINPLVTIAMGVLLLGERLRPAQWAAVATGLAAVLVLAIGYGQPPWISLVLAFSFATYGLVKKKVDMGGLESLAAETAVLFVPALGFLLWLAARGESTFVTSGAGHGALLAATGIITAIPLICFGAAAIRVPLSVLGLLQYLAPVFQFALGILYFHEEMPPERWAGFALVWVALALLTWEALRTARRTRAEALRLAVRAAEAGAPTGTDSASAPSGPGSTAATDGGPAQERTPAP
ncbi:MULTISPECIES: EamA family transporter RarD [unclassified Streptomyces]|uniref:EamA family transporter RarD n=1 Tax=unclassified Streptomyces TaxID=2593676 RepID=UPI0001C197E9|nr:MULTISPECIES: EamA family transporter RarD [unclassified Streptomyces]MYR70000.1 EamA family transporter RarD [Streptomyces sp. SID4939]MYR99140.1 EamA family transporter RarD [Streptomyces sp. SID4940]MYT61723.1 EamA family transporter RarD [Streptomyces sp. SID8357]MYT85092.1 EamA family transporter RarD [Streptomyces sp. SID8360]MYW39212.1 EamA family transporter RarD [Streptomyces sp. SID1]